MVRVEKTIDLTDGRRSEAGMGEWMGHPEPYVAMIKGTVARREARIMEHSAQQSDVCHDRSQPQGIAHRQIDLPHPLGQGIEHRQQQVFVGEHHSHFGVFYLAGIKPVPELRQQGPGNLHLPGIGGRGNDPYPVGHGLLIALRHNRPCPLRRGEKLHICLYEFRG